MSWSGTSPGTRRTKPGATRFLGAGHELVPTDLVLAELVYGLEGYYWRPRREVAAAARSLLALPGIAVLDLDLLLRTVELYESLRVDLVDAYLAAAAEAWGIEGVASFHRRLDRVRGIVRFEP
jgi:uncharacterized protein